MIRLQGTQKNLVWNRFVRWLAIYISVLAAVLVVVTSKRVKMRHVPSLMYLYRKACVNRDCFLGNGKFRLTQAQKSIANLLTIVETYILTTSLRNSAIF